MMRGSKVLLASAVIGALAISAASANGGAIVDRGQETGWIEYHWDGGNILTLNSTSPDFYCASGDYLAWDYQIVTLPNLTTNYHDKGYYFLRAYDATPADLFATPNPWDFICSAPPIAEGIVQGMFFQKGFNQTTQQFEITNGAIIVRHTYSGGIADLAGLCGDGIVLLSLSREQRVLPNSGWPDCVDCVSLTVSHGPTLDCL